VADNTHQRDRIGASPSTRHVPELLADFVAEKGVPDAFASVGCGSGPVAFDAAERRPGTSVVGYNAAESILAENRRRARESELENLEFEKAVLPEFEPDREFDLVLCCGTLCYVSESTRVLRSLYGAVAPGGHLVVGYSTTSDERTIAGCSTTRTRS